MTPAEMEALKTSIRRDGMVAPVLVRTMPGRALDPEGERYEIIAGNHRVMACRELGLATVPAIIADGMDDRTAARLAVNTNTVHGDPTAELLAPFLAEMEDEALRGVHLPDQLMTDLLAFDDTLARRLHELEIPDEVDARSPTGAQNRPHTCECGNTHEMGARMKEARAAAG